MLKISVVLNGHLKYWVCGKRLSAFGKKGDEQQRQLRAEVIVMRHPLTGLVTT
jgi:hypothetical protein